VILDQLKIPVVLAPLAGGPSTPELAAAVAEAGGLGFLAAGYLSASALVERIEATRSMTGGLIGINVFVPGPESDPASYGPFLQELGGWADAEGITLGVPRYSDDDWEAKLDLLTSQPPHVVSFTFGCPDAAVIDRVKQAGAEAWVTVTAPEEARQAERAGADVLVLQGAEAGGHRASFVDRPDLPTYGLLALLSLVGRATSLPMVASGGIATPQALAAALAAGARAAQVGTAFMLTPEAGTAAPHRAAIRAGGETALTRAFSGRLARGIRNQFLDRFSASAPIAYPELHYVTSPMRQKARKAGNPELVNLWAGQAHALAEEAPAADIALRLAAGARTTQP
jgi:nitronate monooxygenase